MVVFRQLSLTHLTLFAMALSLVAPTTALSEPPASVTRVTAAKRGISRSDNVPIAVTPSEKSFQLNEQGVELILKGNKTEGIKLIEQARDLDPSNTTVLYNLAGVYLSSGQQDSAIEILEHANKLEPKDPSFANRLAEAYFAKGDIKRAATHYERVVNLDRNYDQALHRLGTIYGMMNKWDDAEKTLKECHSKNPENHKTVVNLSSLLLAKGQHQEAIKLITDTPDFESNSNLVATLGIAYDELGQTSEALNHYNKAISAGYDDKSNAISTRIKELSQK